MVYVCRWLHYTPLALAGNWCSDYSETLTSVIFFISRNNRLNYLRTHRPSQLRFCARDCAGNPYPSKSLTVCHLDCVPLSRELLGLPRSFIGSDFFLNLWFLQILQNWIPRSRCWSASRHHQSSRYNMRRDPRLLHITNPARDYSSLLG